MTRRPYFVSVVIGSVAVSGLAVGFAASRDRSKAGATPTEVRKTADIVDKVVQERFQRRLEIFGLSRVVRPGMGDMRHSRAVTPDDLKRLKIADAEGTDYRVLFYPTRGLSVDKLEEPRRFFAGPVQPLAGRDGSIAWTQNDPAWVQTVADSAITQDGRLRAGQATENKLGDWWLFARPVKSAASCVSCHKAAKTGDTLGVMLYAVRKAP